MSTADGSPLRKMPTELVEGTAHYVLRLGANTYAMNALVGRQVTLRATGVLSCVRCERRVKKLFGQGFCFPCFQNAPENSECIVRPELCRAHLGEGRDPAWESEHHNTEHVVYLSFTGQVKVGVTRSAQVPTRWIDQGAASALVIARTPYRQLAGLLEVALKEHFADRTHWRQMLRPLQPAAAELVAARERLLEAVPEELRAYLETAHAPQHIHYPVQEHPPKVTSVSFDKLPEVGGTLVGIQGQYLLWRDGRVLNVRNQSGVHVELMIDGERS